MQVRNPRPNLQKRKCVDSTLNVDAEAGSKAGANGVGVLVEDKAELCVGV